MTKPLEGVRVVDLSQITSGPFGTMVLAEQGADVVKVESPMIGDLSRWAPNSRNGMSSFVLNQNRGKRSIAVDLQRHEGQAVALDLMAGADVVVQNFRPGVVERLGLGYDDIRPRNPGVIYVSISGFGPDGPYADRPALDPVIQALSGVVYRQQSEVIPLPDLVRNIFIDKATALTVAQSACAALYRRTRTGEGDHIVVPMLDVGLYFFWPDGMMDMTFLGDGIDAGPRIVDLYQITHCADGQLVYYVATDSQREGLFGALGHPEWSDDPRFESTAPSSKRATARSWAGCSRRPSRPCPWPRCCRACTRGACRPRPCSSPSRCSRTRRCSTTAAFTRGSTPSPVGCASPGTRCASSPRRRPVPEQVPGLGEHTDEILAELGRTEADIATLRAAGTVA